MPRVARRVHSFAPVMLIVVGALLLTGCPPPPLSLDEPDAADNSPPGITSVRNETGEEFAIGTDSNPVFFGTTSQSSMTLTLEDAELDDTLYVRAFREYNSVDHPPARAVCNVGPSTPRSLSRSVTCGLSGFCSVAGTVRMDIYVFDRVPDDAGALLPPYVSVDAPGKYATRSYQIDCQEST